jgi:hypothetical protein
MQQKRRNINICYTEYEYLLDVSEILSSSFSFDAIHNLLENNSPEFLEYDLLSPHLKDTIQNNASNSSNLDSPHLKDTIQNNTSTSSNLHSFFWIYPLLSLINMTDCSR